MTSRERRTIRALTAAFLAVELFVGVQVAVPTLARAGPEGSGALIPRLRADGFTGTDQALVANAKWVCGRFTSTEWNYAQVADKFRENNPMTVEFAALFVADSVAVLCPAYTSRRNAAPGGEQHSGTFV